ncbi:MAG: nitroreductase family protein [Eubacteriales bacterium]|nr:nitroreductase family protein [Eubacteriales bacterium]
MLLDLLKKRYSCRQFSQRKIDPKTIDYILECGRLSPSGGNEQPWKFGVITDPAIIQQIAQAASVNVPQKWIATAPLIIVLCTQLFDCANDELGLHRFPSVHEQLQHMDRALYSIVNMEEHQTKIPGEHMVLAALEQGVYSTWISSVDCEKVGELLGLKGYLATNVLAFGYPEKNRSVTSKKGKDSILFFNHFT